MTSSARSAGPGRDWMEVARGLIEPAMRAAVDRLDPANRLVAGYHLGFSDAEGAPAARSGGKGVRGALALLSARAAGAPAQVGIPAAVACELVHEASLLHDDIVDRDAMRRGAPAAWTVFGAAAAILAGDALLTLAFEVLADAGSSRGLGGRPDGGRPDGEGPSGGDGPSGGGGPSGGDGPPAGGGQLGSDGPPTAVPPAAVAAAVSRLAKTNRRLLAGQVADLAFESRDRVAVSECLAMVADKTGALLSCASCLGAVLAGGPGELVSDLAEYGRHLGTAFQLVDDLLGIWGSSDRTGKPVWSDLRSRKKSLPVTAAMSSGSVAGQRLWEIYRIEQDLDEVLLGEAASAVEAAGGRAWASDEAERETRAAMEIVARLDVPDEVRGELAALAAVLGGRDR